MYGVKTLLFRFEHSFINVFSKHQFYRFFKDVLNKTLTFEVPIPPKMEAENYKKNVIIRKIKSYFDVHYKIKKIPKFLVLGSVLVAKIEPSWSPSPSKITKNMDLRWKKSPRHPQGASETPPRCLQDRFWLDFGC